MRYYDLIETPKSGKTFLEGGSNRLPQTDINVSIYFQSVDLSTKERYFDDSGYPQIRDIKLKALTDEEVKAQYKSYYLEVFNTKLKELDYDDIATVAVWANKDGSTFQAEAKSLINWYEAIINKNYELINAVQAGTISTPTKEEYLSQLPLFETFEV